MPILGKFLIPCESTETISNDQFRKYKEDREEVVISERHFIITRFTYPSMNRGNLLKIVWRIEERINTGLVVSYVLARELTKFYKMLEIKPVSEEIMDQVCHHIGANPLTTNDQLCNLDFSFRQLSLTNHPKRRRRDSDVGNKPTKK